MQKYFSILVLLTILIFCASTPVSAAPQWGTMDDTGKMMYQVDKNTISFSGEDTDRTLEIWVKVINKDQTDSYSLTHLFIKENMMYMEKEHGKYSTDGTTISSTDSSAKGWGPLPPNSPGGRIAKQLFADYRAKNLPVATIPITVDPQEVQKVLDDNKIKHGLDDKSQTKWFYVRDTYSGDGCHSTFDLWLLIDANNSKTYRFNFSTYGGAPGRYTIKEVITVRVDGKDWVLSSPQPPGVTTFPDYKMFSFSFNMPYSLVQAIMTTKNAVTVKWNLNSYDHEYTIPFEFVHNMILMYAGCK